jgi:hypothetical protein
MLAGILLCRTHSQTVPEAAALPNAQGEQAVKYLQEQGLYTSLGEAMQKARYSTNWVTNPPQFVGADGAYQANNPAQSLNAFFTREALYLSHNSGTQTPGWQLGFKLKGCGYGDDLLPVRPSDIRASGTRVEMERLVAGDSQSTIVEWYENRAEGLEQGFTINQPPIVDLQLRTTDQPLRIVLSLNGDLHAAPIGDGRSIALTDQEGGQVLSYGGLVAKDATGRELTARMTADGNDIVIETDDSNASYPIVIDPTFLQQSKLTASDGQPDDRFGQSIAIDNDTIVVGAELADVGLNPDRGAAYVFVRNGSGWTPQAKLSATDGVTGDHFGRSVSISGETIVVGADSHSTGGNMFQGAAYVFVRNGTAWIQQAELLASDGAGLDSFGFSVAIGGETVVVGAPIDDINGNAYRGSAYVFTRNGTTWGQQAKLTAADGLAEDLFGYSTDISGDTIVIAAPYDDVGPHTDQGSAYVFVRTGTVWTQQTKLVSIDGGTNDYFAISVAISGETIVAGAHFNDVGVNADQGAAYVFVRTGTTWAQQAKLIASDGALGDELGSSVSISGASIVASATTDKIGGNVSQGSAYVFSRVGTTWVQESKLTASDGSAADFFGWAVSITDQTVVVSANFDDVSGNIEQGSAYVFSACNGPRFWTQQSMLTAGDGEPQDEFGNSVSVSGDTVVIGVHQDDIGGADNQGSAYVFIRSGTGWTQQAKLVALDGEPGSFFGSSVSIRADTVVVGAREAFFGIGCVYVFARTGTSWSQQTQLFSPEPTIGDQFGTSVSFSGDTIVVGAQFADFNRGSAYVFARSETGWILEATLTASDGASFDNFGVAVSTTGETVVVGATGAEIGTSMNQGAAYVFVRNGINWSQQAKLLAFDGSENHFFGWSVAIDDETIVVGAPIAGAYVFVRNGTTWPHQAKLTASDGVSLGYSVAKSGETLVVGSFSGQGSVYVCDRTGSSWVQRTKLTASDGAFGDFFGTSASINAETIAVGAPLHDTGAIMDRGSA